MDTYDFALTADYFENINLEMVHIKPAANYFCISKEDKLIWIGGKDENNLKKNKILSLDFLSAKALWRYARINKAQEPILRAIAWKAQQPLKVLDVSAGLGRDSAMMACAGALVDMCERNVILQILLAAALTELKKNNDPLIKHLNLLKTDAITYLEDNVLIATKYDVIYIDPMFPHRQKSALVKQDLRIVRDLVGDDLDADQLLIRALATDIKRIVVKRPINAPNLAQLKPQHSIFSTTMRFDVYLR